MVTLKVIFLLMPLVASVHGSPSGPPMAACNMMRPMHGPLMRNLPGNSYSIVAPNMFNPSGMVNVQIGGAQMFKGAFLQVRDVMGSKSKMHIVGDWMAPTNSNFRLHRCNKAGDGVSHANRNMKTPMADTFTWKAPATCMHNQNYYIRLTVVKSAYEIAPDIEMPIRCHNPPPMPVEGGSMSGGDMTENQGGTSNEETGGDGGMAGGEGGMTDSTGGMSGSESGLTEDKGSMMGGDKPMAGGTGSTMGGSGSMTGDQGSMGGDMRMQKDAKEMEKIKPSSPSMYCANNWAIIPEGACTSFEKGMGGWRNVFDPPNAMMRFTASTGSLMPADGDYYSYYYGMKQGDSAIIRSPYGLKGCFCFSFHYHNKMGATISISIKGNTIGRFYSKRNVWIKKSMTISTCDEVVWIMLTATHGSGMRRGIGIDNIMFKEGPCKDRVPMFRPKCSR